MALAIIRSLQSRIYTYHTIAWWVIPRLDHMSSTETSGCLVMTVLPTDTLAYTDDTLTVLSISLLLASQYCLSAAHFLYAVIEHRTVTSISGHSFDLGHIS